MIMEMTVSSYVVAPCSMVEVSEVLAASIITAIVGKLQPDYTA
jgi:hypothetical protein